MFLWRIDENYPSIIIRYLLIYSSDLCYFDCTESSQNLRGEDVGVLVKRGGGMDYLEETTGLGLAAITLSYANTGNRTGLQRWQARALPIPYLGP